MPELPEVETVKNELKKVLVGQEITQISQLHPKSFVGDALELPGYSLSDVTRRAKMMILELTHPSKPIQFLQVHLKMTGQLIYDGNQEKHDRVVGGHPSSSWIHQLPDKHTRIIIHLSQGTLYFNDQRLFGWVKQISQDYRDNLYQKMPPDIIDQACTPEYFFKILQRSARPIKVVIMDSQLIGGVGNIYANDALFDSGIDPTRPAKSLNHEESNRLLISLQKLINLSISLGGATTSDKKFVNTQGLGGKYQDHFLVYERQGQIVSREGKSGKILKIKVGGRGTYWVPELQK